MSKLNFFLILFISGFIISCAGPQYTTVNGELIPYGVNSILIDVTEEDRDIIISQVSDHLIERGYEIDQVDYDEQLIVTDYFDLEYKGEIINRLLYLNVRVIDVKNKSFLLFTGQYRGGGRMDVNETDMGFTVPVYVYEDEAGYNQIYHPRYSGPNERIAWQEFLNVAQSFGSNLNFASL